MTAGSSIHVAASVLPPGTYEWQRSPQKPLPSIPMALTAAPGLGTLPGALAPAQGNFLHDQLHPKHTGTLTVFSSDEYPLLLT